MADTIWFRHDVGALSDRLMQRLMRNHGMEGVGVYWGIIEVLYQEEGHIHLGHIEDLAFTFHVLPELVDMIVRESGLFIIEGDWFSSERVMRELEIKNEKSEKARNAVNSRKDRQNTDEQQSNNGRSTDVEPPNNDSNTNAGQTYNERSTSTEQYSTKDNITPLDSKESCPPSGKRPRFVKPTVDQVRINCVENGYAVDPEAFIAFYDSNGWKVGRNPMKDWKAAVRTWEKRKANDRASPPGKPSQRTLGNDARWDEYLAKQEVKNASQ